MINVTKKSVLKSFQHVISIPYCEAQYLFPSWQRFFFTSGVYGWNSDIFIVEKVAISTGYRPFGTVEAPIEICKKYDDLAKDNPKKIKDLQKDFVVEVLGIG